MRAALVRVVVEFFYLEVIIALCDRLIQSYGIEGHCVVQERIGLCFFLFHIDIYLMGGIKNSEVEGYCDLGQSMVDATLRDYFLIDLATAKF